jgi:hypothetical protein
VHDGPAKRSLFGHSYVRVALDIAILASFWIAVVVYEHKWIVITPAGVWTVRVVLGWWNPFSPAPAWMKALSPSKNPDDFSE